GDNSHYAIDPNTGSTARRFFVQFLQTTPGTLFILENVTSGSLLKMAKESNPVIGPSLFGCGGGADCFAQFRAENLNVLAINFYNHVDYTVTNSIQDGGACEHGFPGCPLTPDELATLQCFDDPVNSQFSFCTFTDPVHFDFVEEVIR